MRYVAFFAVALFLIGVGVSESQQISSTPAGSTSVAAAGPAGAPPNSTSTSASRSAANSTSGSTTTTPGAMTPLQTAELHAAILIARKEYAEAVRTYKQILAEDPKNPDVLNRMGIAYQQLLDFGHAERCYKKAIKADKTAWNAINNLGTVEYGRRHYGNAVKYYKKSLALHPEDATIHSNLGYAYFDERKYPEAMTSFGKALRLDPEIFEHRGDGGSIIQQRSITDPGMFHYFVAKSYALMGDAEHAAHFLKLARDEGYKKYVEAKKDPAFARVLKDIRVQQALEKVPAYATGQQDEAMN
ncbi:MAG TPA: tetratricopeptide repeat protein [Candidatus Acidoferrales bacterium]|nr:tetratricopeptide repeat protein [Candidatus Acidoferrales bacterium]